MAKIRLAAVQAAPVFLDLPASTDKMVGLIEQAGSRGAQIVGFPEGFLPGHPGWVELLPADRTALELSKTLFLNAVELDGDEVHRVRQACRDAGVAAVVGVCERLPMTTGTLYNSQLFIDETGQVACARQKIVPTVGERLVHAPGRQSFPNSFRAHGVTVSGLICGENSNPLAQYASSLRYPTVHVAAWPQHFNPGVPIQPVIELVSKGVAYSLKCFVLNSVAVVSDEMVAAYGTSEALAEYLVTGEAAGRASVVDPAGSVVAAADGPEEQIVYADIDSDDVIIPKFAQDTAGHYNRPELFRELLPQH